MQVRQRLKLLRALAAWLLCTSSGLFAPGAFHIKPKVKINCKDNFNFSPRTEKKEEARLIIAHVKSYQGANAP